MSAPLVSCVMPTCAAHRRFVDRAIDYFLRQDHEHRELIVVDDPDGVAGALVPTDPRIHYLRLAELLPLGAKRNVGCEAAHGDIVVHWDVDDWMAPHRLTAQVATLADPGCAACGCADLLHYALEDGEAWLHHGHPWVAGCSLAYRRTAWRRRPFPAVALGEDSAWIRDLEPGALRVIEDDRMVIALAHRDNTAPRTFTGPRWERREFAEVARALGMDLRFYAELRNGARGHAVRPRPPAATRAVALFAPFAVWDGYGSVAEPFALGLAREGARLAVVPTMIDREGLSEELCRLIDDSQPVPGAAALLYGIPVGDVVERAGRELFVNTMWEADRLPPSWIPGLNRARVMIVPTRFVARVARASGVQVPIAVVPEGIDPALYPYVERPEREGLTTLTVGLLNRRKHTAEAVAAWKLAFDGDPDARLIVKARFQLGGWEPDDPRIRLVDANERTRGIARYYHEADILLQLGNEGFGLPLVEGMATGLPAVALVSEGHGDVHEDAPECLLAVEPVSTELCDDTVYGPAGHRGVPNVAQAARRLRWIAGHREEARAMGRRASEWVHAERSIWAKAPAVLDVMEHHAQPPRALRSRPVLWARGAAPDPRHCTVAHVVHGDGAIADGDLLRFLFAAREQGVVVAITELAVATTLHAWERDAAALIAETAPAAERLRAKWPAVRVELVAPACPAWAGGARRRRRPGVAPVVATIAEQPSCAVAAHAVAADLGGEVLVVQQGPAAAARIASAADMVVLWHEETPVVRASHAARTALASGVPVVANDTSWTAGLERCLHRSGGPAAAARRVQEDAGLRRSLAVAARDHCEDNSRLRVVERHRALWRDLEGR